MKKLTTLLVAIVLVLIFVAYMVTFQVRYDQVAVLTTFDRAVAPTYAEGKIVKAGSLRTQAGLHFKAPWPIQQVYSYSKKLQVLNSELAEIQTADGKSVIIKMFLTWRIQDPWAFYKVFGAFNKDRVEAKLKPLLSNLEGVVTSYRFDQLVNNDPKQLKLGEIESKLLANLRQTLASIHPNYGIAVENVGIRRLLLPESTTKAVFDRMKATRETLAEDARAEGRSQAATIEAEAKSARDRILAFARRRAEAIRAQGDREAASYYKVFSQDESFAKFLRQIRTMKKTLSNNSTFIVDSNDLQMTDILRHGPQAAEGMHDLGAASGGGPPPGIAAPDHGAGGKPSNAPAHRAHGPDAANPPNTRNTPNHPNTANTPGAGDQPAPRESRKPGKPRNKPAGSAPAGSEPKP